MLGVVQAEASAEAGSEMTLGLRTCKSLQGETAYGLPIADGQHPNDLFMELAALYDLPLGERGLLSFYIAPEGDPAIGPTAYPHRASAFEDPVGTLGHHQEDSTHISNDVATWTGLENAGRTKELLIGEHPLPRGFIEEALTHVQAYTFGYDRDVCMLPHVSTAIGAQMIIYSVGRPLQSIYGTDPIGVSFFIWLRPGSSNK